MFQATVALAPPPPINVLFGHPGQGVACAAILSIIIRSWIDRPQSFCLDCPVHNIVTSGIEIPFSACLLPLNAAA